MSKEENYQFQNGFIYKKCDYIESEKEE